MTLKMDSINEIMRLCRLCLAKDEVNTPIFEEHGDIKQILLKISACLPVKVSKEDNLPKNICDGCSCKLEMLYHFWSTSANSEKKLIKLLDQIGVNKLSDNNELPMPSSLQSQQHSISSDPVVLKQEVVDVIDSQSVEEDLVHEDLIVSNDQDYLLEQEQIPYQPVEFQFQQDGFETVTAEDESTNVDTKPESESKPRKRRAAAMKALATMESEDEDDPDLIDTKIAKTEEQSDESAGEDPEPTTFVGLPSADDEQPGPSGVGKPSSDAPKLNQSWSNRLPEIDIIPVQDNKRSTMIKMGYKNPFNYTHCDFKGRIAQAKAADVNATKWNCIICNEVMRDKRTLIEHYENHKNEQECKKEFENAVVEDYFKCTVCTREFTSTGSYEKHLEQKHGENRYACQECNKTYKSCFYLCLHNNTVHSKDQNYRCVTCDFVTIDRSVLKLHLDKHEEDLKYKCDICDKKFFNAVLLDEHKNSHTGAMPFQCEICSRSFPYASYLVSHKKSIHSESAVNKCRICLKQFAHRKSLILHIRSHTGENSVLCDMCGKRLSSTEHLKQHLRIHTGYKPHACSVCGKGFAKKSNLTLHERVHSGEKPYVCRECGKCFSQRSTLVIHERYHSGERPYTCPMCNKGFVAKGLLGVHIKSCSRLSI